MYFVFGIFGILSGLLLASADLLLDLKGRDNQDLGELKLMKSAWEHMGERRFRFSILLASLGAPMQLLGCTAMAHQLGLHSYGYGLLFWIVSMVGVCGSFFIHSLLCLFPVIYKYLKPELPLEKVDGMINRIYDVVKGPFWTFFLCLVAFPGVLLIIAIFNGYLPLSRWYALLTAPVLTLIGLTLRAWKPRVFYDLPGIVMPSLGVGAIGLLAVISML